MIIFYKIRHDLPQDKITKYFNLSFLDFAWFQHNILVLWEVWTSTYDSAN